MDDEVEVARQVRLRRNWRRGFVAAGVAAAVCLVVAIAVDESPQDRDVFTTYDAQVACEEAVAETFKSPDSAEFAGDRFAYEADGEGWRVTGEVDAMNPLGVDLRHDFSCVAKPSTPGRVSVRVESVTPR